MSSTCWLSIATDAIQSAGIPSTASGAWFSPASIILEPTAAVSDGRPFQRCTQFHSREQKFY
jgi:hypothetical protein